ncbi:MAG TPA: peptidylprolyl isomerase [Candidatus Polarisedimenticolia bacterium]|nr:peptidylprolyl isomerase [Candidatus Polarisedimenticolia bacterium]
MKWSALITPLAAAALLSPVLAAKDEAKGDSPVVATVNGEPVTKSEWSAIWKADQWQAPVLKRQPGFNEKMQGKPYEDFFFREEVVKVRAMAQKYKDDLGAMKTAIDAIHQQIAGGGDFAELARKHSQDQGSAPNGGDLGEKEFHQLTFPFNRIAFGLKTGEVSEPFLTVFGYHVLKVEQVFPASPSEGKDKRVRVRNILIRFPSSDPLGESESLATQAKVEVLDKGLCKKLPSFCPQES